MDKEHYRLLDEAHDALRKMAQAKVTYKVNKAANFQNISTAWVCFAFAVFFTVMAYHFFGAENKQAFAMLACAASCYLPAFLFRNVQLEIIAMQRQAVVDYVAYNRRFRKYNKEYYAPYPVPGSAEDKRCKPHKNFTVVQAGASVGR